MWVRGSTGLNVAMFSIVIILAISIAFAVIITPTPSTQNTSVALPVNYSINITNNGGSIDSFNITLNYNSTQGTVILVPNVTGALTPGQYTTAILSIIPNRTGISLQVDVIANGSFSSGLQSVITTVASYPSMIINSPTNGANYTQKNISLNYTVYATGTTNCWFMNVSGNVSLPGCINTSFIIPTYGNKTVIACVNDSFGQQNCSVVNFLMTDNTAPVMNISTPNGTMFSNGTGIFLDFLVGEESLPATCQLHTNATGNTSISTIPAPNTSFAMVAGPLCNGIYGWYVTCQDNTTLLNTANSSIGTFAVNQSINNTCPAQGAITGYVKYDNGSIAPGINVSMFGTLSNSTLSDGSGFFAFGVLPIGSYGFQANQPAGPPSNMSYANITYQGESVTNLNLTLPPAGGGGNGSGMSMSWLGFNFSMMPYSSNGENPGLPPYGDLSAVWISDNASHVAFQIFASNLTGSGFCGGAANTTLEILIDSDSNVSTGCNWTSGCFKGADYMVHLGGTVGSVSLLYFNSTNSNWSSKASSIQSYPANFSNCSSHPTILRFAVPKSDIGNPTKPEINVFTRYSNGTMIDKLTTGASTANGCPTYNGNQTACENSLNTIGMSCLWKSEVSMCMQNFTAMSTCDYFCGVCSNQTSCETSSTTRPPCLWSASASKCTENTMMTMQGANCDQNCFNCFDQYNCESKGAGGATCSWSMNPINPSQGICGYSTGLAPILTTGMDSSSPVFLGPDNVNDSSNQNWLDLGGFGLKEGTVAYGLGTPIINATGLSICGGSKTGKFVYFVDSDNSASTGKTTIATGLGLDYKIVLNLSDYSKTLFAWNSSLSDWVSGSPTTLQPDENTTLTSMACGAQSSIVTMVKKSDIGNPISKVNIYVMSLNSSTDESSPVDQAGPYYYAPGTIDFKPVDCFQNPTKCGTAFAMLGGGKYMPLENCISTTADLNGNGLSGCNDPDCFMMPWCASQAAANNLTDKTAPYITLNSVDKFADFAFIQWITNEPANGTLKFYKQNTTCTLNDSAINIVYDVGDPVITFDDFKPFHGVTIKNGMLDSTGTAIALAANQPYYYKTVSCDMSGNCAISGCLNFTTQATSPPVPMKMEFAPDPFNNYLNNMQFQFVLPNGTTNNFTYQNFSSSQNMTNADNVTVKLTNPNSTSPWSIDLQGISIAKAKELNLTNAMVVGTMIGANTSCPGSSCKFVGMNSSLWQDMAQNLGVKKIRIKIPQLGTQLQKCDDNGQHCVNATSQCTLNSTGTDYTIWDCPVSLGFSVFAVYMAETITTTNTGSTSGSGGAPAVDINASTHAWDIINGGTEMVNTIDGLAIAEIRFTLINTSTNAKMTVTNLVQKPSDVSDIYGKYVFKWINIYKESIDNTNIGAASIKFKVLDSWIGANNIDSNSIRLMRFNNGNWDELQTIKLSDNSYETYYQSTTPGFSYFSITGTAVSTSPTNQTQQTNGTNQTNNSTVQTTSGTAVCGNNLCESSESQSTCCLDCKCPEGMQCTNNQCSVILTNQSAPVPQVSAQESSMSMIIIAVIVIVIIVVLLVYLFVIRKGSGIRPVAIKGEKSF